MYSPLPDDWDDLIRTGAPRKATIDIYGDPAIQVPSLTNIPVETYQIEVSRQSSTRRSVRLRVVDPELLAEFLRGGSSLEPYGSEIRMSCGFELPDGTQAMVPVGKFQIEELDWNQEDSTIDISGFDRSQALQRTSYGTPIDASGKQALVFIQETVDDLLPYSEFVSTVPDANTIRFPGGTTYRAGVLSAVQEAAATMGAEFYFDVNGDAVVAPVPFIDQFSDPASYDWIIDTGEDGVLVSYGRKLTRKDTFNKVHVWGAPARDSVPQPYASVLDDNPASPTYYGGRFGKADIKIERQELLTDSQCRTFALAKLRDSMGLSKSLDLVSLSNPALDAGDRIRVIYPDGSIELHIIDAMGFSQTGAMTISTRSQQVS